MGFDLEAIIKQTQLTRVERRVADYILGNSSAVCFMSVTDIAQQLGISESSVTRFCRTLGYKGFPALQRDLRDELSRLLAQQNKERTATYLRLPTQRRVSPMDEIVRSSHNACIRNVEATFDRNPTEKFDEAGELIINAHRTMIVGFRGSSGCAQGFGVLLSHLLNNVIFLVHESSKVIEYLLEFGENDCIIIFACERYNKMARLVAEMAREYNCKLIVVTDRMTAPVAFSANVVFTASAEGSSIFHSFVGMQFVAESLINVVISKLGPNSRERMERMEKYISQMELY